MWGGGLRVKSGSAREVVRAQYGLEAGREAGWMAGLEGRRSARGSIHGAARRRR